MLGLTFDKLVIVAIVAAVIVGPQRLPGYAERLRDLIRSLQEFVDLAKARAESEAGLSREEWEALDPRRYDPRRIVWGAFDEEGTGSTGAGDPGPPTWTVAGSSGHPRRQRVMPIDTSDDDPPPEA